MLSRQADELYARIVDGDVNGDGAAAGLQPAALGRLLIRRQRMLMREHQRLLADFERLSGLANPVSSPDALFEPLTGEEEVFAAQQDFLGTASAFAAVGIVAPQGLQVDPPHRVICTWMNAAHGADTLVRCRVLADLPVRMLVTDEAALVMLSPAGTSSAVVIRAPVMVQALAGYFETLWERASPLDGRDDPLPRLSRAILTMLADGMTDAAIARTLEISPRSVRRHIAALEKRAGVNSRFALGAAAVRLGWLG